MYVFETHSQLVAAIRDTRDTGSYIYFFSDDRKKFKSFLCVSNLTFLLNSYFHCHHQTKQTTCSTHALTLYFEFKGLNIMGVNEQHNLSFLHCKHNSFIDFSFISDKATSNSSKYAEA